MAVDTDRPRPSTTNAREPSRPRLQPERSFGVEFPIINGLELKHQPNDTRCASGKHPYRKLG